MDSAKSVTPPITDPPLSNEEWQILDLLAKGYTNKEIVREIGRTKSIVDKMLSNGPSYYAIYPKIGVTNAKGAVAWYLQYIQKTAPVPESPVVSPNAADIPAGTPRRFAISLYLTILVTAYICLVLLTFVPIWLRRTPAPEDNIWANMLALVPALVGVYGLCRKFGNSTGLNSIEQWAWRIFSAGLIAWAIGGAILAIYSANTLVTAPYPSIADYGFFIQTSCQTIAFMLWWRESYHRGAQHTWLWPLIALPFILLYLAIIYTIHDPRGDAPSQRLLDLFYTLGDSSSVAISISLILRKNLVAMIGPIRRSLRFLAVGMILMFLSGLAYISTSYLPEGHVLKYTNGNPIDFFFATAFLLMGIAIGLVPQEKNTSSPGP